MIWRYPVGITLGTVAALNQNRSHDYAVMTAGDDRHHHPHFRHRADADADLRRLRRAPVRLGHSLPVGGWNGGALANMILPVTVLALPQIAIIARLMRGSMIEVLRSNYIRTARAKGLPSHLIVFRHALRAALLPLVSYLGPAVAGFSPARWWSSRSSACPASAAISCRARSTATTRW